MEAFSIEHHLNKLHFKVSNYIDFNKITLNEASEYLPGWIHINTFDDLSICWMSDKMKNDLQASTYKAIQEGPNFLQKIIHPETDIRVIPKILSYRDLNDPNKIIGFIQMIRYATDHPYLPHYTTVKLSPKYNCFFCQTLPIVDPQKMIYNYLELFGGNEESTEDFLKYQSLTKREKEILQLIAIGKSNSEIANQFKISALTVKTHRQNIIKKLDTSKIQDLIRIALTYSIY